MPAGAGGVFGESVADLILRIIADASQYEEELKKANKTLSKSVKEGKDKYKEFSDQAESSIKKIIHRMYDLNVVMDSFTKRIDRAGISTLKLAAVMSGPFIAAMVAVRNTNQEVALQFSRIGDSTTAIADTMADVAVPYTKIFADLMEKLGNKIQSMSPFLKDLIGKLVVFRSIILGVKAGLLFLFSAFVKVLWALTKFALTITAINLIATFFRTGAGAMVLAAAFKVLIFLVTRLGFALGYMIGFLIRLPFLLIRTVIATAALIPKMILLAKTMLISVVVGFKAAMASVIGFLAALGPLGIAVGVLGIIMATVAAAWIANWGKIREYTNVVLKALTVGINTALDIIKNAVIGLFVELYRQFIWWKNILKGPQEAYRIAGEAADKYRQKLKDNFKGIEVDLVKFANNTAVAVDGLKAKIKELWAAMFAGDLNKRWNEISAGFQNGLRQMLKSYEDWGEFAKTKSIEIADTMNRAFSDFFFDAFMGELDSLQEYMASFGRFVLRIIADIIAQLITALVIKKMLGFFSPSPVDLATNPVITHEGGLIPVAHAGMAPGERIIRAQVGEGVLSRNGMATLGVEKLNNINAGEPVGGGGLSVNLVQVIRAWSPEDVYRERKVLTKAMIDELERNGLFRKAMNKFR